MMLYLREFGGVIGHIAHNFLLNGRIYFLWFIIYSFIGWFYESTICSMIKYHRFINRGFLKGPLCPIYGAGAVLNYMMLGWIGHGPLIFVAAMMTSGVVEYFTSYAMERLFHQRWWDYTRYRFNLKGRICLYGCVIFGVANVIILKVIHPVIMYLTSGISEAGLTRITILLYVLLLIDIIYTTVHMESVNNKVKQVGQQMQLKKEYYRVRFEDVRTQASARTKTLKTDFLVTSRTKIDSYHEFWDKIKDKFDFRN